MGLASSAGSDPRSTRRSRPPGPRPAAQGSRAWRRDSWQGKLDGWLVGAAGTSEDVALRRSDRADARGPLTVLDDEAGALKLGERVAPQMTSAGQERPQKRVCGPLDVSHGCVL